MLCLPFTRASCNGYKSDLHAIHPQSIYWWQVIMTVLQDSTAQKRSEDASAQDERWLLAKRIARSSTFTRSDRLSKLLLYVCRMHIAGRDEEIKEQRIGIDVFRRTPSFDSGSDSIVRPHATRLRQRLELYFTTEGSSETLRIEVPRGGYTPRFFPVQLNLPVEEI
jgi:hypothetical protein